MPHLDKEENNKRLIKIIIKITIVIKEINPTSFIITNPTKTKNFKSQTKNFGKQNDKNPVCYRCGKIGHFQKNCKVKKEIYKIDINKYNTEQLKNKFL